jgi:hypothetical protein
MRGNPLVAAETVLNCHGFGQIAIAHCLGSNANATGCLQVRRRSSKKVSSGSVLVGIRALLNRTAAR